MRQTNCPLARRRVLHVLGAASLSLASALRTRPTSAARQWCRVDPVLRVDGQTCHVAVAARVRNRREARALSTGPIRVAVAVPTGAVVEHVASDAGYGHGYEVTCEERAGLPAGAVEVTVYVPMGDGGGGAVPVRVWFAARGRGAHAEAAAAGTANTWLTVRGAAGGEPAPGSDRPGGPGPPA